MAKRGNKMEDEFRWKQVTATKAVRVNRMKYIVASDMVRAVDDTLSDEFVASITNPVVSFSVFPCAG